MAATMRIAVKCLKSTWHLKCFTVVFLGVIDWHVSPFCQQCNVVTHLHTRHILCFIAPVEATVGGPGWHVLFESADK